MSVLEAAVNQQCVLLRLGRFARAASELYVCEGLCSCSAWARLQTSRSSETGHSRALGSTSCEITLTERGRGGKSVEREGMRKGADRREPWNFRSGSLTHLSFSFFLSTQVWGKAESEQGLIGETAPSSIFFSAFQLIWLFSNLRSKQV